MVAREVVNTASSFTIEELTGLGRTLRLVGRALPYRPLDLSTQQRVNMSWLPGNPEATATVTGRKLTPTTIQGVWKDKFISTQVPVQTVGGLAGGFQPNLVNPIELDGSPLENVRDAIATLEDFCERGALVEVTWDEQTRHGHLERVDASWENRHDVRWQATFQWISKGEPSVPAVFVAETSLSDTGSQFSQLNSDLQDEAIPPPFPLDFDAFNEITDSLSRVEFEVFAALDTTSSLVELAFTPFDATRRMIAIATSLAFECQLLNARIVSRVDGALNVSAPLAELSFGQRIRAADYSRRVRARSQRLRAASIERRARLTRQIRKELLASVTVREGADLRDVSQDFYGTPFEWRRLMTFNELTSPRLSRGQIILVPKVTGPEQTGAGEC